MNWYIVYNIALIVANIVLATFFIIRLEDRTLKILLSVFCLSTIINCGLRIATEQRYIENEKRLDNYTKCLNTAHDMAHWSQCTQWSQP